MRFCGTFWGLRELGDREKYPQMDTFVGEGFHSSLLPVDHADRVSHLQPGFAQRPRRRRGGAAGGDHVLDETHELALLEGALDAFGRPVVLRFLADDQERQTGRERRRGRERDRAELRPGEANGPGLGLMRRLRDRFAERTEQLRPSLEEVLVEGAAGTATGTKDEVAFQVRVLAQSSCELRAFHVYKRAVVRTSRA